MASIVKKPNGTRLVQFVAPDKKRRVVRLGKLGEAEARTIAEHIAHLAECARYPDRPINKATDKFVGKLFSDPAKHWLYDRMATAGLVTPRDIPEEIEAAKLGNFIDAYVKSRTDIEPTTEYQLKMVRKRLVDFFGENKPIHDISPADADAWRLWLQERVGPNTTRRSCGRAKQFFRWAVRKRLLAENPFADQKDCGVKANKEREFFVNRAVSEKVLESCPDSEWQLIFALSRFGGLRCPSEHLRLTWDDIAFEHDRMTVHSPKTKKYEGKESRVIPIFPELRPYLEAQFNKQETELGRPPSAADHVITGYRGRATNLRTQLQRILKRAGVEAWPKLFQNLRASRATELAAEFPAHVAAAWLGHSTLIAQKHYWQVTDADFEKAVSPGTGEAQLKALQNGCSALESGRGGALHETQENAAKHGKSERRKLPRLDSNQESLIQSQVVFH